MFLPTTRKEFEQLGWDQADIILVSGDSYIDSPFIGLAVIGRVLLQAGYRVGVIAQPDTGSGEDICRLGEPALFWGVTGGSIDSMIANYTASKKKRHQDDYTPGGNNNRRPDRAVIAYTNLIRRYFKTTRPIVLGGIEASLRRIAHYEYWSDKVRRSILFDSKADYLLYGMAEKSIIQLADQIKNHLDIHSIRGLCYIAKENVLDAIQLPSYEQVEGDKMAFIDMFHTFYQNNDPLTAKILSQRHGDRFLIQNPPSVPLAQKELDAIYTLGYQHQQHPFYERLGQVRALETIRFSISTHRGCYGECNFCAIAVHEGRRVTWRSEESILAEAEKLTHLPEFKGYIQDVGGPSANMYAIECKKKIQSGSCTDKRCLYPDICPALKINHKSQIDLLKKLRGLPGVKKVFVASGIRYDMVLHDHHQGDQYLYELVTHHVSGQLKIAPEHTQMHVLEKMGKPGNRELLQFKEKFDNLSAKAGKQQFLTYYLIAAHPGCSEEDMAQMKWFASQKLHINPEQVQIFTPSPSTYSSLMYYTEMDPFTRQPMYVEKDMHRKERQKQIVVQKNSVNSGPQ